MHRRRLVFRARRAVSAAFAVTALVTCASLALAQTVRFQQIRPPDIELSYSALEFADATTGILIGERVFEDDKSAVYTTTDSGENWQADLGSVAGRLLGGSMLDPTHAWVVGEAGAVMATKDGGATWDVQTSKALTDLYEVQFVTPEKGWAVGQNSTVVTTNNGGRTWNVLTGGQPSGEVGEGAVMYMGAHFLDETTGFVAGAGITGIIAKTTDGGETWTTVYEATDNLSAITFADPMNGWAGGKYGLVLATTDGGVTWEQVDAGTEEDIYSIAVGNAGHIWLSGDYGTIGYSEDLGQTWQLIAVEVEFFGTMKELTLPIMGITAVGNSAWAVTNAGRVLHFMIE